jgi:hypothetical protein
VIRATPDQIERLIEISKANAKPESLPVRKVAKSKVKRVKVPQESEANFQRRVIDLAHFYGWRVAHFRPAQNARGDWRTAVAGDGKGFPDLVLVRDGALIFAELKRQDGRVSPEQKVWLEELNKTPGVTVCVWRPADWELIIELLGAKQ